MVYGMMSTGWGVGMSLLGILFFALGAFVFSAIFWCTYKWIVMPAKKKK